MLHLQLIRSAAKYYSPQAAHQAVLLVPGVGRMAKMPLVCLTPCFAACRALLGQLGKRGLWKGIAFPILHVALRHLQAAALWDGGISKLLPTKPDGNPRPNLFLFVLHAYPHLGGHFRSVISSICETVAGQFINPSCLAEAGE